MSNNQIHRMLRKRLAATKLHVERLEQKLLYVLGFVEFIGKTGLDMPELERRYREHIEQQGKV